MSAVRVEECVNSTRFRPCTPVADTTRTFSELTAAFVIQVFRTDSVRTDAVAAIVINVTILASGLYICYEVAVRARVLWRRS